MLCGSGLELLVVSALRLHKAASLSVTVSLSAPVSWHLQSECHSFMRLNHSCAFLYDCLMCWSVVCHGGACLSWCIILQVPKITDCSLLIFQTWKLYVSFHRKQDTALTSAAGYYDRYLDRQLVWAVLHYTGLHERQTYFCAPPLGSSVSVVSPVNTLLFRWGVRSWRRVQMLLGLVVLPETIIKSVKLLRKYAN